MINKTKALICCLAIIIALYVPGLAQNIGGYDMKQMIPLNPKVKEGTLENGLKYFIMQNKKPENRAELQIVVRAGSTFEDPDQLGLAHFLEHMAFNGTKNFPKMELVGFLESTGMRFGADVNASTSFERTHYTITIPLDKPGLLEKGLLVLEDWLSNVTLDPQEIEKERGVVMEEWRLRLANAQGRMQTKHFPVFLAGSRYADRMPIGDTAVLQHANVKSFERFYKEYYRPNISALIVVGDIDVNVVEKDIKEHFSDIKNPANPKPRVDYDVPINAVPAVSIAVDKELPTSNYAFIFKRKDNDFPEGSYGEIRQSIMANLFNTVLNYRLDEVSHKSNSPYLYAGGSYGNFLINGVAAFNLVVVPKVDKMDEAYSKILEEGFRITRFGVTPSELERAKAEILRGMEQNYNERDKTESMPLALELYRHFNEGESVPGIELEYKLYQSFMPTISADEMNGFTKKLMNDEGLVIAASLSDKPEIKVHTEKELLAMYNQVKQMDIKAYEDIGADKPLMSTKPTPGKIVSRKENAKLGVTELKLSNNATVFLKSTDYKNDQILMRAYAKGGSSLANDADFYSANSAANIVNQSGLGEFDVPTLQKMMQGKVANVSPYISDLSEGLYGDASPKDIELMFQMIYMYFNEPRKDGDAFQTYMNQMKEDIENAGSNPERVFGDTVSAILGNHNLRSMPMTMESLSKVNLDKAMEFYKSRFANAADFKFTFVGNFKKEEIEPMIETYIASLKSSNTKNNFKDNGVRTPKNSISKEIKKGIEPKSSVRLVMNGTMENTPENRYAIRSAVEVMNIRLREVLREDMGGVYGVGARPRMDKYPAQEYNISIGFGTGPEKAKDLIKAAKGVIEEIRAGKFEDKNIQKVKEIMKRENEVNLKENRYWINAMYSYDFNGEDMNLIYENEKMIDKITKESVVAAAKKYFDMKSFKEFVLYPED